MAITYTHRKLAELIVFDEHDTASAARFFNVKTSFIEKQQKKVDYRRIHDQLLRTRNSDRNNEVKRTIDDAINNIDLPEGEGSATPYFVRPVKRGVKGRIYRGVMPAYRGIRTAYRGVLGKPYRGVLGSADEKPETTTPDILKVFDGRRDTLRDYFDDLLEERLSDYNFTRALKEKLEATETYTSAEKMKLHDIESMATKDMTANEIIAVLNTLPVGSRLNINWFDGELNIPTNTVEWHGQFRLRTAYGSGDMVIDAGSLFIYITDIPATNTVRPAADTTRAEHLDAGSPADLINATKSGLTFTFVRRSGDNINLTITDAELLSAIQGMTTAQKTSLRSAIGAQVVGSYAPSVHNHDDRYYTEGEANSRFAGRSHNHNDTYYTEAEADRRFSRIHSHPYAPSSTISATVANVLTAITNFTDGNDRSALGGLFGGYRSSTPASNSNVVKGLLNMLGGFSTEQEGQARAAIKALGDTITVSEHELRGRTATGDIIIVIYDGFALRVYTGTVTIPATTYYQLTHRPYRSHIIINFS